MSWANPLWHLGAKTGGFCLRTILIIFILAGLTSSYRAEASLWSSFCERILGTVSADPPERVQRLEVHLFHEATHCNQYSIAYKFETQAKRLEFIEGKPWSVEIPLLLSKPLHWIRPITMTVFVNPTFLEHTDSPEKTFSLHEENALMILFDDVSVRLANGEHKTVSTLMMEKMGHFLERNPGLSGKMTFLPAVDFKDFQIRRAFAGKTLMWVTGLSENFQTERVDLLAAMYAFQHIVQDPTYVVKDQLH